MMKQALQAIFIICLYFISTSAQANLLISDTRIELSPTKRSALVSLYNNGSTSETYRLAWQEFTMNEDGEYITPATPRTDSAALEDMLVFSPRQVTLAPGESQAIRVLLKKAVSPDAGEMRSHLKFLPVVQATADADPDTANDQGVGVKVNIAVGITIPVVYKPANATETASLSDAKLVTRDGGRRAVKVTIERSGNFSVYGDLKVIDQTGRDEKGGEKVVGLIRNIAVFNEIKRRHVDVSLDKEVSSATKLIVRYSTTKGDVLSEIPVTAQ